MDLLNISNIIGGIVIVAISIVFAWIGWLDENDT